MSEPADQPAAARLAGLRARRAAGRWDDPAGREAGLTALGLALTGRVLADDAPDSGDRAVVDEAAAVLAEAAEASRDDPGGAASRVTYALGGVLLTRYLRFGNRAEDLAAGVAVLERLLAAGGEPARLALYHLIAGQLHSLRVYPPELMALFGSQPGVGLAIGPDLFARAMALAGAMGRPETLLDVRAAHGHLTAALALGALPPRGAALAGGLLGMAELLLMMADPAAADLGRLMERLRAAAAAFAQEPPGSTAGLAEMLEGLAAVVPTDWTAEGTTPAGMGDDEILDGLRTAAGRLPPGHPLRYVLDDAIAERLTGQAARTSSLAGLDEAARRMRDQLPYLAGFNPLFGLSTRRLGGLLVVLSAADPTPSGVDELMRTVEELLPILAQAKDESGMSEFLDGLAQALKGTVGDDPAAGERALAALTTAAGPLLDHELGPAAVGLIASLLLVRGQRHGIRADREAGRRQLAAVEAAMADRGASSADRSAVRAALAMARLTALGDLPDPGTALEEAIGELAGALADAPAEAVWRPGIANALGLARIGRGSRAGEPAEVAAGAQLMVETFSGSVLFPGGPRAKAAACALATAVVALARRDVDLLDGARRDLAEALDTDEESFGPAETTRLRVAYADVALARFGLSGAPADLDGAIGAYEAALAGGAGQPGLAGAAGLLRSYADALLTRGADGDRARAVDAGLALLRATGTEALMQADAAASLTVARGVAGVAQGLAALALTPLTPAPDGAAHDPAALDPAALDPAVLDPAALDPAARAQAVSAAVQALELGRGLVLYAATAPVTVPALLEDVDAEELAARCRLAFGRDAVPAGAGPAALATLAEAVAAQPAQGDLWPKVLDTLRGAPGGAERLAALLDAPPVDAIADALTRAGRDALVYLLPAASAGAPGWALAVDASGRLDALALPGLGAGDRLDAYSDARADAFRTGPDQAARRERWRVTLAELCDWAGTTVAGPVLSWLRAGGHLPAGRDPALVIAACGRLGIVPWHAARLPGEPARYLCEAAVVSTAATARQLIEATSRPRIPAGQGPVVFVAPASDLLWAARGVAAARGSYPDSVLFGLPEAAGTAGPPAGEGTPAELLAALPGGPKPAWLTHVGAHGQIKDDPLRSWFQLVGEDGADEARLDAATILAQGSRRDQTAAGGELVLTACVSDLTDAAYDEALTLSTALLAAGATSVIGTRWEVYEQRTAIIAVLFHHFRARYLSSGSGGAADALRAAQRWMIGRPDREPLPASLTGRLRVRAEKALAGTGDDLADPVAWAAFTHQGA
jgi:hypothetical protein